MFGTSLWTRVKNRVTCTDLVLELMNIYNLNNEKSVPRLDLGTENAETM